MKKATKAKVGSLSIATFNIQWFGKYEKDYDALFSEIRGFDVIGVEEIMDARLFRSKAIQYLGDSWEFVSTHYPAQKVGLLFNSRNIKPICFRTYDEVNIGGWNRPGFIGEFEFRDTGQVFYVMVVHLKSGMRKKDKRVRKAQWLELATIIKTLGGTDKNMVLLGDMNCFNHRGTNLDELDVFIRATGFVLATGREAFSKNALRAVGIDHVLVSPALAPRLKGVSIGGAYLMAGKKHSDDRKAYRANVSDHCPVIVRFKTR